MQARVENIQVGDWIAPISNDEFLPLKLIECVDHSFICEDLSGERKAYNKFGAWEKIEKPETVPTKARSVNKNQALIQIENESKRNEILAWVLCIQIQIVGISAYVFSDLLNSFFNLTKNYLKSFF